MDLDALLKDMHESDKSVPFPKDALYEAVKELVPKIFSGWKTLNAIIERHEALIRKRWSKKSVAKRRELLLSAWPNMPTIHRPDFDDRLGCIARGNESWLNLPDRYSCPYINLEDLIERKCLLVFLNARGRNRPHTFALSELEFALRARMRPGIVFERWPNTTMTFIETTDPNVGYGNIVHWPDLISAKRAIFNKDLHPADGLQVLQIQRRIWDFLIKCCELILHEIPREVLISDAFPILPEPPSLFGHEEMGMTFAKHATMAPYRSRSRLDFARLNYSISALFDNAKDHLWALREDPSYFTHVVQIRAEHRDVLIQEPSGNTKEMVQTEHDIAKVLRSIVREAYYTVVLWDQLHQHFTTIEAMSRKYPAGIDVQTGTPEEYFVPLVKIYYSLGSAISHLATVLKYNFQSSPPLLRQLFVKPEEGPFRLENGILLVSRDEFNNHEIWPQVYSAIAAIGNAAGDPSGVHLFLDILETLCRKKPSARDLISSRIDWLLTQLSIIAECMQQFEIQPWSKRFIGITEENRSMLKEDYCKPFDSWKEMYRLKLEGLASPELGDPSDGRFYYPVHKKRNKKSVDAMRRAKRNLDAF